MHVAVAAIGVWIQLNHNHRLFPVAAMPRRISWAMAGVTIYTIQSNVVGIWVIAVNKLVQAPHGAKNMNAVLMATIV